MLPLVSRVIARILATGLREWSEKMGVLDENQAGFRRNRSTLDAAQIMLRIQEDAIKYKNSNNYQENPMS